MIDPQDSVRFQTLVAEHGAFVRALARRLLAADPALAADAEQETWLRTLRAEPGDGLAIRPWLGRVLRNVHRTLFVQSRRRDRREQAAATAERVVSCADEVGRQESIRRIAGAVADLDEPYRSVIVARFYENLPPRLIACQRGVPVTTVKSQLQRGLVRIRLALEEQPRRDWRAGLVTLARVPQTLAPTGAVPLGSLALTAKLKAIAASIFVLFAATIVWIGTRGPLPGTPPAIAADRTTAVHHDGPLAATDAARVAADAPDRKSPTTTSSPTGADRDGADSPSAVTRVRGRLLDAAGAPIAGALVRMRLRASHDPRQSFAAAAETHADAAGRFAIERVLPGENLLSIDKEGFTPVRDLLFAIPAQSDHDLRDLTLQRGRTAALRVVDGEGRGVGGARVLVADRADDAPDRPPLRPIGVTAADGALTLRDLADATTAIAVMADGYVPQVLRIDATHPLPDAAVVTLERGFAAHGEILGAAADAELIATAIPTTASSWGRDPALWQLCMERAQPVAGDRKFRCDGLPLGESFYLKVEERCFGQLRLAAHLTAIDQDTPAVTLQYIPLATLLVCAVDARSGEAILDIGVVAVGGDTRGPQIVVDRPDSRIAGRRLLIEPDEQITLDVTADGYRTARIGPLALRGGQTLEVPPVTMTAVPVLRMRVTEARSGRPVAGADVRLAHDRPREERGAPMLGAAGDAASRTRTFGRTDADGRASLDRPDDATMVLRVEHPEFAGWHTSLTRIDPDAEIAVALVRGASVTVLLRDPTGHAATGTAVQCEGPLADAERSSVAVQNADQDGHAVFLGLSAGRYRFHARIERSLERTTMVGGSVATVSLQESDLVGEPRELDLVAGDAVKIELSMPVSVRLSGTVRAGGRAIGGVELRVVRGEVPPEFIAMTLGSAVAHTTSAPSGTYLLDGILEGDATLIATHADLPLPVTFPLHLSGAEVHHDVALPITRIRGTVSGPAGPIAGAAIDVTAVSSADGRANQTPRILTVDEAGVMHMDFGRPTGHRSTTAADGSFEIMGLPSDAHLVVTATADFAVPERQVVTLRGDETRTIDFRLAPAGAVRILLRDVDGGAVINTMVTARPGDSDDDQQPLEHFTSGASDALFHGLREGTWKVRAAPMGEFIPTEQNLFIRAGEITEVTLSLPRK